MRRLVSQEEEARKKKKNQTILVLFLAAIMVMSTIGFAIQSNSGTNTGTGTSGNEVEYNGYKFTNQNGLWVLGSFVFQNLPGDVPNLGTGIKGTNNYQGKPAYIYSEDSLAEAEVALNLGQIALRVQKACPEGENTNCPSDLPVKTCSDNFIIIKESNTSLISQDNNCVYIGGQKTELVALADQLFFKILGVK